MTILSWVCQAWGWISSWVCNAAVAAFGSKHLDLQNPIFFYQRTVPQRASTFIHEAPHASGKAHRGTFPRGSSYGSGTGADESWEWDGSRRWQAVWLAWYSAAAEHSTTALRSSARDQANVILLGAFTKSPGFTF